MELGLNNSLLAGDQRLVDHIVGEVKSQGIFDQFRKECLADVDTKPAYQNLRTRVEGSVSSFLNKQTWKTDLNKNQLRETLRKHIHEAPYLEVGVERIVDQVVHPKVYSVFMPQVEDVVYKFLGIERPKSQRNGSCDLKDLLPKDLDPVSPESDRNSLKDLSLESMDENIAETVNGNEEKSDTANCEEKEQDMEDVPGKKEVNDIENGENSQNVASSPIKVVMNSSFKSDETNKTEEEEEESPMFEPIDIMNLNESNMSNDSHLSGISELTSHRSRSPDFITEFSRDNFDNSNQDSQLSKVSSNSRLSIVTDFGSSNHASTPLPESKEDSKYAKDNFKDARESDSSKDKFNFEVIKGKENSKTSIFSKENSRDASEFKDSKNKEEYKSKNLKDKYDSKNTKEKDHNSRRRHNDKSNKYSGSKSKDKSESDTQESKESSNKTKESKEKECEKKEDSCKEVKDLKDLYKEKIRELREKKELTEKEKLGKDKDLSKTHKDSREKKDSSLSKEKDDFKKSHKSSSSSSSRSSSYHNSKSSKNSESKESREKSKRDDRRHSNGKNESRSSSKSKRDSRSESKSESRSNDRSLKDKKRRDEKKSKSIDDHSSLRKNFNDRRSTDRDGSNGSSSKYSHKNSYSTNNSSGKLGPTASLAKENNDQHSNGETTDNIHDSLELMFSDSVSNCSSYINSNNPPKRVDPGAAEICLPLKKRPLQSDESASEDNKSQSKKAKVSDKKSSKRKVQKDIFKIDADVTSVPDEERVQIIEVPDEEYEQPYPNEEPILSLEETKKIILDAEPIHPVQSKLSEMEQSIRQSLNEMMSDHKLNETEDTIVLSKLTPVMDSSTLLETLTDDSNNDSESLFLTAENSHQKIEKSKEKQDQKLNVDTDADKKNIDETQIKDQSLQQNEDIINIDIQNNENFKDFINADIEMLDHKMKETEHSGEFCNTNIEQKINTDIKVDEFLIDNTTIKNTVKLNEDEKEDNLDVSTIESVEEKDAEIINTDLKESLIKKEILSDDVIQAKDKSPQPIENVNIDIDHDGESTDDNTDEFNEDDKLVIDEEFDEKENDDYNEIVVDSESNSINRKLSDLHKHVKHKEEVNKKYDKETFEQTPKEKSLDDEITDDEDIKIIKISETSNLEKIIKYTEDTEKQIKDRLIDELGKLNEDGSDSDKPNDADVIEISVEEKINTVLSQEVNETNGDNNTEKIDKQIEKIEIVQEGSTKNETKIDVKITEEKKAELNENNDEDKNSKLIVICGEKEEDEEFKSPSTVIPQEDSNNEMSAAVTSIENEFEDKIPVSQGNDKEKDEKFVMKKQETNQPTTSKSNVSYKSSRKTIVVSPIEEDCYYLDSQQSHQRYLKFKKFLEKLEADPNRSLENMIESYGGVVVPAMPMAAPVAPIVRKHKLSVSPIGDVIIANTNNNLESSVKESSSEDVGDDASSSIKKRKIGRTKKAGASHPTTVSNCQMQQQPLQQHQQVSIVNGENFVMPLSPESDVSAGSEKNPGNVLRDERSHRSSQSRSNQQRYSSDDLYKPRPLFTNSSRRNRRFNQA